MIRPSPIAACLVGTLLALPASADAPSTVSGSEQILECLARNVPPSNDLRRLRLTTTSAAGHERVTQVDAYGRRTQAGEQRLTLHFTDPPEVRDSSVLIIENEGVYEFHLHTPGLGPQRRVEASEVGGKLFGTDFTYEDIVRFQGLPTWIGAEKAGEATVSGRPVWLLETRPVPGSSAYSHIVSAVDQERCVVVEAKMYEMGASEPRKVYTTDPEHVLFVNTYWLPQVSVLRDVRDQSHTEVALTMVVHDPPMPEGIDVPRAEPVRPVVEPLTPGRPPKVRWNRAS